MKMPGSPTAALTNWFLIRVTTVVGTTLHAGGVVLEHPNLAPGLPTFTSSVSQVADDRTWLATANRIYSLSAEEDLPGKPACVGLVSVLFERHHALPRRIEFLKRDGSVYLDVSKREMAEWLKVERAQLRTAIEELLSKTYRA